MSFKFKANLTQLFKQFQFICDITANRDYYTNPLLTTNSPDPGVVRLVDGSGWAMVTTSNNVSRRINPVAFPMYYSSGRCNRHFNVNRCSL